MVSNIQLHLRIYGLLMWVFCGLNVNAQIRPGEGDSVNYRIVGFIDSSLSKQGSHTIEIAEGVINNNEAFQQHIISKKQFIGQRVIMEVPAFGKVYTWRMYSSTANTATALHHFKVMYCIFADTNYYRVRILKAAQKYKDGYVFLDAHNALYNMKGEPVWFVPSLDDGDYPNITNRDMKISPWNTITLLYRSNTPYEINWDGKILWKAPNTGEVGLDSVEGYHHEFTRLKNGHYMVLGNERSTPEISSIMRTVLFGTVIEYDKNGKVLWSWKSSKHYRNTFYKYTQSQPNFYDIHQNSFYFDEKRKAIYVGYKNISQIVKVKYPSGQVENVFGKHYEGPDSGTKSLFYEQHTVSVTSDGKLLVYNNHNKNNVISEFHPKVMMFDEVKGAKHQLKSVWEYEYTNNDPKQHMPREVLTNGGNVHELPDRSFFVSMCAPYNHVFIVGRDKKLYWEADPQRYSVNESKWTFSALYRGSMITDVKKLEALIWGE